MQAWELEREWGKAQDKLKAIRAWYEKTKFRRGQLPDDAWIALYKILEGLDKSTTVIPIRTPVQILEETQA